MLVNKQKGAALLAALMVLAICVTLVTFILMTQRVLIRQADFVLTGDRMMLALQGVQDWALESAIKENNIRNVKEFKSEFNGVKLTGMIYALGGRFNINVLQNTDNAGHFSKLVRLVSPEIQSAQADVIANNVSQWLQASGGDDSYYLQQNPPYRMAHQPIFKLSEMRLIKGVNKKNYAEWVLGPQPYLTALPIHNLSININYVSLPVLMAFNDISETSAVKVIQCRDNFGFFKTIEDFARKCAVGVNLDFSFLTTDNEFFQVESNASQGVHHLKMTSLIAVTGLESKPIAKVLWQEFNGE